MKKILAICFSPDKGGLELYLVKMIDHFNKKFSNVYGLFCPDSYIAKNIQSPHLILKKPSFSRLFQEYGQHWIYTSE